MQLEPIVEPTAPATKAICKNCGAVFYPDEEVGEAVMIHPDNGCQDGVPQQVPVV